MHKAIKDAKRLSRVGKFDYLIMTSKWNITQASSPSKAQESVYKNEASGKFWRVWKFALVLISQQEL